MKIAIRNIINSTPESRQSKNMFRGGRDAEIVNRTNYGSTGVSISYSGMILPSGNRGYRAGSVLLDGKVFCGGSNENTQCIVYDPINNTATACITTEIDNNVFWSSCLLADGKVFIPPYGTNNGSAAKARIYSPETNIITILPITYPNYAYYGGLALLDGRVFFTTGGSSSALVLNPLTQETITPSMRYSGGYGSYAGTLLTNGRLASQEYGSDKLFVWDPDTNTHKTITFPSGFGYSTGDCLLPDGSIFFISYNPVSNLFRHSIYNPYSDTISLTSPMINQNYCEGCRLLPNGKVLLHGYDNYLLIYDPIADNYTQTDLFSINNGYYLSSVALQDGRVMLCPSFSPNSNNQFIFIGEKLPKILPTARACSPFHNKF